jgi:hypothetical protein
MVFLAGGFCALFVCPLLAGSLERNLEPKVCVECDDEECGKCAKLPVYNFPNRFWFRGDYLYCWTSETPRVPLVTTSPPGTPSTQAGVLPNATILYGDQPNNDCRSGARATVGMWIEPSRTWGLEFDYLTIGSRANNFDQNSTGDPILARPFFNIETGLQASHLVAYPGIVSGSIAVDAEDYFQSAGALVSYFLCSSGTCGETCDPCLAAGNDNDCFTLSTRTDLLAGFRYYNLSDRLGVVENTRITQTGPTQNTTFQVTDNFRARNDFYGAELGLRTRMYRSRWSFEFLGKLALGNTHQMVTVNGQTVVNAPNQPTQTFKTGFLGLYTNGGSHQADVFTMVPQLGAEMGYQVSDKLRVFCGYNLIYWACVSRAADQIDLNIDPRNLPPPLSGSAPFPTYPDKQSSFWAQGINAGFECRF